LVEGDNDRPDLAREGLEHLQAAAHEVIAAARSLLDACEEVLEDPRASETLASIVGSVSRVVGGITGLVPHGDTQVEDDDAPRVQRIKIS
jgi:hypothetical protein